MMLIDANALEPMCIRDTNGEVVLLVFEPNEIVNAPTIDAAPVVHAHWVGLEYDAYADGNPVWNKWECSNCGNEINGEDTPAYCCDCGARMDEVDE